MERSTCDPTDRGPPYLSDRRVRSLGLTPTEVMECVERAMAGQAAPLARALKSTVTDPSGNYFQALPALLVDEGVSGVKWVSVTPGGETGPSIRATILLTSAADGRLLGIVDGTWVTAARTAAMSALAARRLARPDAERIGFVGCGAQARSHLRALRAVFPRLHTVVACGRSSGSADTLCKEAGHIGMAARASSDPREAVAGQDIVVSTVPATGLRQPFLDGGWLDSGTFVAMVDLGRSWRPDTLGSIDVVATDDRRQSGELAALGKLALAGPYAHELADLVSGAPGWNGTRTSAFVFGGLGVCDVAVALLCHNRAATIPDVDHLA